MAVPIEGYSVVAQRTRIDHMLEDGSIEEPNSTVLADDDIWRVSFMAELDAQRFMRILEELDLNISQGPDSDVVLVSEFDRSVTPYCEWLVTGQWGKAVIAWKAGTQPETVVAREGWDPKVGSGLHFHDSDSMDHLEFLRLEDRIEVYLDKNTGKEVFIGRTSPSLEALFKTASESIGEHFVTVGEEPLSGEKAKKVAEAIELLDKALAEAPEWWNALWYRGKGYLALGNCELAYESFRRAYELERNVEAIPQELAGVCLELGKFEEAVDVAERAASLDPKDVGLIGNLAVAYLLAGRITAAKKSIAAAISIDGSDSVNNYLNQVIAEVAEGKRPQPHSMAELSGAPPRQKRRFWEFWKRD